MYNNNYYKMIIISTLFSNYFSEINFAKEKRKYSRTLLHTYIYYKSSDIKSIY